MPSASNPAQFEAMINQMIKKAVEEIAKQTLKEMTEFVIDKWYYDSPAVDDKDSYNRTYDFLTSLMYKPIENFAKGYMTQIGSNSDFIFANYQDSFFSQHMSFDNSDVSEFIAGWIEKGQNSSVNSYSGIKYLKHTNSWLKKNLYRIMREVFGRFGIKVTKG